MLLYFHILQNFYFIIFSSDSTDAVRKTYEDSIAKHLKSITNQIYSATCVSSREKVVVHLIEDEEQGIGLVEERMLTKTIRLRVYNFGSDSIETKIIDDYERALHGSKLSLPSQTHEIVQKHCMPLFERHSNLEAIIPCTFLSKGKEKKIIPKPCIVFYCSMKGYIPSGESEFPKEMGGFPIDI